MEFWFLFSARRLMMVYTCSKCHENIFDSVTVVARTRFHTDNFIGPSFRKNADRVMVRFLCIFFNDG